jgi:hypothetical protein
MVPGPRIRGSTSAIVIANAAASPRKPKTRSFQATRLGVPPDYQQQAANHRYHHGEHPSASPNRPREKWAQTATIIKATRITAGQTRRARKAGGLT